MKMRQRPSAAERQEARSQLTWALLLVAGLVVPITAGVLALDGSWTVRVTAVLVPLALLDAVLVTAGARGRGAPGVVQPWRWGHYLFWLAVRVLLLAPVLLVSPP